MTLLEAISGTIRRLHYSPRTEEAYLHWIRAYIAFHGGRHPRTLGGAEITAFLNHLAVDRHTSASTSALSSSCTAASSRSTCPTSSASSVPSAPTISPPSSRAAR